MGYVTDFEGHFTVTPPITDEEILDKFEALKRRRMFRDVEKLAKMMNISTDECIKKYGKHGEFWYDKNDNNFGQNHDESIIDHNSPPPSQPGLWCMWEYDKDVNVIKWDGGDKFYNYIEWIIYIINEILAPKNYVLNGTVEWSGEDPSILVQYKSIQIL